LASVTTITIASDLCEKPTFLLILYSNVEYIISLCCRQLLRNKDNTICWKKYNPLLKRQTLLVTEKVGPFLLAYTIAPMNNNIKKLGKWIPWP
jgi:hypothetical protein